MKKRLPEIGQRIKLSDTHPHAGKTGTVTAYKRLIIGRGARVKLEEEVETTCFVFHRKDWKEV